jgi:hypothetical protein
VSVTYDNYYHPVIAKGVAAQESQRTYPAHRAMGVLNAAIVDPPLHFAIPATFSKLVRMPFYQSYFFVTLLFILWTGAAVFVLARKAFNATTALIALAFGLIPASATWLFPLTIGFTPTFEAFFFFPFILFLALYALEHKSVFASVLAGVALAAQFLTHGPFEAGLAMVFLTGVSAVLWWKRRDAWIVKSWAFMAVTAGILSLYQFMLLRLTRITGENIVGTLLAGNPVPSYFPKVALGWLLGTLFLVGILALVLSLFSRKLTQPQAVLCAFVAFLATFSFSDVLGVDGSRTYRMLYVAYPFWVLLPAVGIVALWNQVKSRVPERLSPWFVVVVVALIAGFSVQPLMAGLAPVAAGGQATPERMQALQWVREHTPADARVFYLWGFEHEFGMLGERVPYKGDFGLGFTQRNIVELCSARFPENFSGQWGSSITVQFKDGAMMVPAREGLFGVRLAQVPRPGTNVLIPKAEDEIPLSGVDYVVFQERGTQADPCMAFFLNQSLSRGAKVAWRNSQFAIVEVA